FDFLNALPKAILSHPNTTFVTPTEILLSKEPVGELDVPHVLSWADTERDLSAWTGNQMQQSALQELYAMEESVIKTNNKDILEDWRKLQTSDHFYYMCTKWFADGDVHKYFNPYESPYEAYIAYMNAVQDLAWRIREVSERSKDGRITLDYKT
ncbi:MAG: alpha-amylase, partial [bacterium]|nr:alpha-amylase [bacterium]